MSLLRLDSKPVNTKFIILCSINMVIKNNKINGIKLLKLNFQYFLNRPKAQNKNKTGYENKFPNKRELKNGKQIIIDQCMGLAWSLKTFNNAQHRNGKPATVRYPDGQKGKKANESATKLQIIGEFETKSFNIKRRPINAIKCRKK